MTPENFFGYNNYYFFQVVTLTAIRASNHWMQPDKDFDYIERILAGNTSDFALLIDKYKDMVFTIAYRIIGVREDAEEIAQDVFLKAYNGLSGFRKSSTFSTWLYRIAYNHSISKVRVKRPVTRSIDDPVLVMKEVAEEDAGIEKVGQIPVEYINNALNRLDETDRIILTLFYQRDIPVKSIAGITGLSVANVKVRMHRSRKKLLGELKQVLHHELMDQL